MARLQRKSLSTPDETRTFPNGKLEIFDLDDVVVGRTIFQPGWRWSKDVKDIAGTPSCQYHHLGVVISGTLHVEMDDGLTLEIGPDSAFEIPPGHDAWVVGDEPYVTIDYAGMRSFARPTVGTGERILGSILFTDVVDSTATLARVGDPAWRDLLRRHNELAQFELDRYRGRLIKQTGDGLLALFDGTERAVRCASAIAAGSAAIGLPIRAGIHTGEIERIPGDIRGVAVHMAARVMAIAGPGEILVSASTRELLAGSALEFEDRGNHELKGLPGSRQLFAVRTA
ncbi:MAG TPA: adenylate/guanylate cyclase domain-containing protein [Methylomirabilota bacterium]|jgi:class 3 adenylate cyclase|nr:adenylate/guanylate cyclase domain-containing protein [Methylomirabilota bacterium]